MAQRGFLSLWFDEYISYIVKIIFLHIPGKPACIEATVGSCEFTVEQYDKGNIHINATWAPCGAANLRGTVVSAPI